MAGVDGRFHREQAQHQVGAGTDLLRTLLAPRPDRRADVVHRGDTALFQPALHAQVEVRGVDADEHVRLPLQHPRTKLTAQLQQARQVAQDFGQAHHRQLAGIEPGQAAGAAHRIAANPGELGVREPLLQFAHQAGAKQVAGGFTGNQRNPQRSRRARRRHRSRGLSACSMKSSMSLTSALCAACSASCTLASASGRPATYNVR